MSGPDNSAAKAAQRAEDERMRAITGTQARINQVFNDPSRAADIADAVAAAQRYGQRELDEQKDASDRSLRFSLARSGLTGGSVHSDQQEVLGREYAKGSLAVKRKALGLGSQLETADQDARARLIALATSGLDATTAAQQSAAAMRSTLEGASATAMTQGIGDFFGQTKGFADRVFDSQQRRKALRDSGISLYGNNGSGYGGT